MADSSIFDFLLEDNPLPVGTELDHSLEYSKHGHDQESVLPTSPSLYPDSPALSNSANPLSLSANYAQVPQLPYTPPEKEKPANLNMHVRDRVVQLIQEYLSEVIPLKVFLAKLRTLLTNEHDGNALFDWIIRSMVHSGHSSRMATFLEENGVQKEELEAAKQDEQAGGSDTEGGVSGEKRKRRERKRVSISRGLRSPPNKWTKPESEKLIRLVFEFGDKSWKKIAEHLGGGKTGAQCAQHWKRVLSPEIRKGSWDDQEEELLFALVTKHGQSWKNIAAEIKTRTDIQCRYQFQKACLSRQCEWLPQEDVLLRKKVTLSYQEHRVIVWTEVSKFIARAKITKIPRTALECKERWMLLNGAPPVHYPFIQIAAPQAGNLSHSNGSMDGSSSSGGLPSNPNQNLPPNPNYSNFSNVPGGVVGYAPFNSASVAPNSNGAPVVLVC